MDLEKLKRDWAKDPQLNYLAFDTVEGLRDHLVKLHQSMMSGDHGCFGYLYRQQTLRIRTLMKELEDVRSQQQAGRR